MSILTKQIREGTYYDQRNAKHPYKVRILAVGRRTEDGESVFPALDFFREEHAAHPTKLLDLTNLIEFTARNGPPKNKTKFKLVEGSNRIFEFKEFQHRLTCFWDADHTLICANGCVKKTDRLPESVTGIAEDWRQAYFEAKNRNTLRHEN